MESVGLEITGAEWPVTHLRRTIGATRVVNSFCLKGTGDEKAASLFEYVKGRALGARVSATLPFGSAVIKRLNLPSGGGRLADMLAFEAANHSPLPVESASLAYEALRKGRSGHTLLLAIARKDAVSSCEGLLSGAGVSAASLLPWQAAHFNALLYSGVFTKGRPLAYFEGRAGSIHAIVFDGAYPAAFAAFNACGPRLGQRILNLLLPFKESVRHAAAAEPISHLIGEAIGGSGISLKACGDTDALYAPSLGAALNPIGRTGLALVFKGPGPRALPKATKALSALAASMVLAAGASLALSGHAAIKRYDSAITALKAERDGAGRGRELKLLKTRLAALREAKGGGVSGPLEILKELGAALGGDSHLTSVDLKGDSLYVEGVSTGGSRLFLRLADAPFAARSEFSGPLVKTPDGRERFRIKLKLKG